jgi:glycerophosphoryl diester phosphodiesterase
VFEQNYGGPLIQKCYLCVVAILAVCAIAVAADPASAPFHIQAHRGGGIARPENTLETFRWAWTNLVTPEADLRTTRDGTIVCFHDANFNRLVSGLEESQKPESIERLPLAEVMNLEVGSFRGKQFAGERVPTLAAVFVEMRGHPERLLYLDVKTADLDTLAKLVREYGVERQVIFTTPDHVLIRKWKRLIPNSMTLLWNGGGPGEIERKVETARQANFDGITHLQIHVRVGDLGSERPFAPSNEFIQTLGKELEHLGIVFQVLPWECSELDAYVRLLELGVDSFATDYPDVTLAAVKKFREKREEPRSSEQ